MFLILGFTNRTSYSLAKYLLQKKKATLVIVDTKNTVRQQEMIGELSVYGTVYNELGNQDISLFDKYNIDKIFISPGVPRSTNFIQQALQLKIEILNDIEYFYREFPHREYIAITGTDGKTTVTTWIGDVVALEKKVILAGNIGNPIFEYYEDMYNTYIFVVELSSFQLESISCFCPKIAVITNIHEDHLDRYKNFEEYALTKKNIFKNQQEQCFAVINRDDRTIGSFVKDINAKIIMFSCIKDSDWFFQNHTIYRYGHPFYETDRLKVVGLHNIYNALMVAIVADLLGVKQENIVKGLTDFSGVSHRLEFTGMKNDIYFYNDSKATTVKAVESALTSFNNPVLLLAGGQSKGIDFQQLTPILKTKVKKIFIFGELAEELFDLWCDFPCEKCQNLQEAFEKSYAYARKNDVILLSPGGASFDEFDSYVHRGEFFTDLVNNIPDN